MDRFIVAAFIATFIAAIAAVIGVPVLAQELAPATNTAVTLDAKPVAPAPGQHGRWSRTAWLAGGLDGRAFDQLDANHDGVLTRDELKASHVQMVTIQAEHWPQ